MVPITRARALITGAAAAALAVTGHVSAQPAPIRVGSALTDAYMEAFYARDRGLFTQAGLNVEVMPQKNGGAILQAAAAGAIDVGIGELMQIANAVQHGVPLAVFASGGLHKPEEETVMLCVAKNASIRTAKDLEGQTVAVSTLNSMPSASVMLWLESGGADLSKVKIFELPFGEMGTALARGTVAAALMAEPFMADSKGIIKKLADPYNSVARNFYIGCFYAHRDWLTQNADAARRFASVIYATAEWANTHRSDSAVLEAGDLKLDADHFQAMPRTSFAVSLDPKLVQPALDLAFRYKVLSAPLAAGDLIYKLPGGRG